MFVSRDARPYYNTLSKDARRPLKARKRGTKHIDEFHITGTVLSKRNYSSALHNLALRFFAWPGASNAGGNCPKSSSSSDPSSSIALL